tara:strand:+ start:2021 stop:2281 length:261 start_codon:yes stop_codon:yes gene_type:complete
MKPVFKAYKILTSLYFLILILGFIFPTRIRDNIIGIFETFSSEGSTGMIAGLILIFFSVIIFWFAPKTLVKLFLTKGNLKKFWDEI